MQCYNYLLCDRRYAEKHENINVKIISANQEMGGWFCSIIERDMLNSTNTELDDISGNEVQCTDPTWTREWAMVYLKAQY